MKSRRTWSDKEDQAFAKITKEYDPKNWAIIAKRLATEFGFKRRSGKQCRERWYNHLVPGISKKVWSKAEEDKLLQLHKTYGNKWTVIAEHLPGRTDNSIKNYFYSTVRRSLRRMGKLIGSKNSTSLMRAIKPSTLTHIFGVLSEEKPDQIDNENLSEEFETIESLKINCENVRDEIIQFSSYKPKRADEISQEEKRRYEKVFQIIMKLNDIYQKLRGFQKNRKTEQEIFKEGFKQMMKEASDDEPSDEQHSGSDSIQDSAEVVNPPLISTRKTRTRHIKIPQKLISSLGAQNHQRDVSHEKETTSLNLPESKEKRNQPQMQQMANSPQFRYLIQEEDEYEDPRFQIQLKDEVNSFQIINYNLNSYQRSPNFYFGTPAERVNFFKSPLSFYNTPKNLLIAALNQEQGQKDEAGEMKVENKDTSL